LHPANQGPLVNLFEPIAVMPGRTLPPGTYVFYFVADQMDGILNYPEGPYVLDSVTVVVQ
ncbi:MAG: hypothetical protein LC725_12765, partial [Lentisphaerae bacterium]|nr:hypothetical protein [Lentisphaerota bacterium]